MPRHLRTHAQLTASSEPVLTSMSGRPRRSTSGANKPEESSAVIVARDSSTSPVDAKKSIRLHFKMPSSKLRDATTAKSRASAASSRDSFEPIEPLRPARSTRAKRAVVIDSASDDEDEEEEAEEEIEVEQDEDEAEAEYDEEEEGKEVGDEGDEDAEGESDVDMQDVRQSTPAARQNTALPKPTVTITPAPPTGKVRGGGGAGDMQVAASATSDEELSELDSEDEGAEEEGGEEDAEGEEVDEDETMGMGDGDDADEDDAEGDSDDDDDDDGTPGSRDSTPDVTKMTKRQRSRLDQVMGNDFLQLPMEPQIKKHLTAEEHAMRRAEMARRRKNLSEKRNEEEKMDTINRLLKKQAPKRRGKISAAEIAAGADTPDAVMVDEKPPAEKADPVFSRWISRKEGIVVALPSEWKDTPVGSWAGKEGWSVVEEVEG